jgi:hypothetical protein
MMLDQIVQRARQALDEQGIDLDLFVMVPSSGGAIITYGTTGDPGDELWNRVGTTSRTSFENWSVSVARDAKR